jgi:hypothetical protein
MKQVVICRPEREQFLDRLSKWLLNKGAIRKRGTKVFKKTFKNTCEIEKKLYFCTRFERHADTVSQTRRKQEEHVPRHIELTAVLREILRQRIESNRIERFE